MVEAQESAHRIRCGTIWGGIEGVDRDVVTNGVAASVFSRSSEGQVGGDIYYFSVCSQDLLTRVAIADMQGHGEQVSELSSWFYDSLEQRMNDLAGNAVLENVNGLVFKKGFRAITTSAIAAYDVDDSHLYFANAGHPPILVRRVGDGGWRPIDLVGAEGIRNLPLGVFEQTGFDQSSISLEPGDRVALYTDGVLDCVNAEDESFGLERLVDALDRADSAGLEQIKKHALNALAEHAGERLRDDDITLILFEIQEASTDRAE